MNFSNKKVLRFYSTAHSKNSWAYIDSLGWKKIAQISADGVTNMSVMLTAAVGHNIAVSGTIDASDMISVLYL